MIASERLGLPRLSSLTDCLPHQVRGLEAALLRAFPGAIDLILDAEVVMRSTDGSVLAFGKQGAQEQKKYAGAHPALLVFDMLWLNGRDLTGRPLRERREEMLAALVPSSAVEASAAKLMTTADELRTAFAEANAACLEGLMMKDVTSKYVPNDRKLWLKLKKDYLTDADCRRARRRPERL